MTVSIESKAFQDTLSEMLTLADNPDFKGNIQLQDQFLTAKGFDPTEFMTAVDQYQTEVDAGRTDFRPKSAPILPGTSIGLPDPVVRTAGRYLGNMGTLIDNVGNAFLGIDISDNIKAASTAVLGKEITDDLARQVQKTFDPYHGDTLAGDAEDVVGTIGSFLTPGTLFLKGFTMGTKALAGSGKALNPLKTYVTNSKILGGKPAKYGALGVGAAALSTGLSNYEQEFADKILESDDAIEMLENSMKEDSIVSTEDVLKNFAVNLGYEAAFAGVIGSAIGLPKLTKYLLGKSKTGEKVMYLGGKYFGSRGGTDDITLNSTIKRDNAAEKAATEANGLGNDLVRSIKKNKDEYESVDALLKGGTPSTVVSAQTADIVSKMRDKLDPLSQYLGDNVFKGELSLGIDKGLGAYITRSYKFFDDGKYAQKITKAADKYLSGLGTGARIDRSDESTKLVDDAFQYLKSENPNVPDAKLKEMFNSLITPDKGGRDLTNGFFNIVSSAKVGKKRQDIPKDIRALWGEVKDPAQNFVNTYTKLSELKAENTFVREITDNLLQNGKVISKSNLPAGGEGFTQLNNILYDRASSIFNREAAQKYLKNPVSKDLYISNDYADFLKDSTTNSTIEGILKYWGAAKGITQAAKTVYNPATHGRNFVGNMIFMGANGMNPIPTKSKAVQATAARIGGYSNEELGKYIGKLQGLGLADSSVTYGMIKDNLKRFKNENSLIKGLKDKPISKAAGTVQRLYEGEDFIFKATHFEKTKDYLRRAFPDKSVDEIEQMAAQRTRDLLPNYNLVPKAIKALRYSPIGDFAAFPAESIRVSKNLFKYTIDDILSGNKTLQSEAYKRAAGMTAFGAVLPEALENYSASAQGITDDQRQAIDLTIQPYRRFGNKVYTSPIKDNKAGGKEVDYIALGPFDPFEPLKVAVKGLHGTLLAGEESEINSKQKDKIALAAAEQFLAPFMGKSMLTEALLKAGEGRQYSRDQFNDRTMLGHLARVFNLPENAMTVGAANIASTFEPGFLAELRRRDIYEKATEKEPDLILSNYYTRLPEPDLKNFLGFGTSKFDITSSIRQNISPLVREIQQGSSKFTDRAGERNLSRNVNQEQLEEMFKDDIASHSDKSLLLKGILNLYDRLGIDNEQIRRGLTRFDSKGFAGLPTDRTLQTVQNSRDNFYVPFNINKNTLARIYGNNPNIDLRRIFEIQDSVYGTRLE
jgi:hypothetical protein